MILLLAVGSSITWFLLVFPRHCERLLQTMNKLSEDYFFFFESLKDSNNNGCCLFIYYLLCAG